MLSVVTYEIARARLRADREGLVREGTRRMLAAALATEVDDYLSAHAAKCDERGRRLVVCNGHARQREGDDRCWCGCGPCSAAGRSQGRLKDGPASSLPLSDISALVPQSHDRRNVAAAVPARAVHRRLRPGPGGVPRLSDRAISRGRELAAARLAGRIRDFLSRRSVGPRPRLRLGGGYPLQGAPEAGPAVLSGGRGVVPTAPRSWSQPATAKAKRPSGKRPTGESAAGDPRRGMRPVVGSVLARWSCGRPCGAPRLLVSSVTGFIRPQMCRSALPACSPARKAPGAVRDAPGPQRRAAHHRGIRADYGVKSPKAGGQFTDDAEELVKFFHFLDRAPGSTSRSATRSSRPWSGSGRTSSRPQAPRPRALPWPSVPAGRSRPLAGGQRLAPGRTRTRSHFDKGVMVERLDDDPQGGRA
jgi:hypothetical protein